MPPDPAENSRASHTLLLHGDYEYLSEGYYNCLEAEETGLEPIPSSTDVLDAYTVPLALERARLAGLPVAQWTLSNGPIAGPSILYGVNPFARNYLVVRDPADFHDAADKISRQGKYVFCCQDLADDARLPEFEQVLGRCVQPRFAWWAQQIYEVFRVPIARVRLIEAADGTLTLSAIERLPRTKASRPTQQLLDSLLPEIDASEVKCG